MYLSLLFWTHISYLKRVYKIKQMLIIKNNNEENHQIYSTN